MAKAWTNFEVRDDQGKITKRIKPGDDVSAGDLGIEDEEFEQLVAAGAVREQDYPVPQDYEGSPIEYAKEQLAKVAEEAGGEYLPLAGSMPVAPQLDAKAKEAMEKIGYDPEKSPEEQSLKDTVDEEKENGTTPSSTSKTAPATPAQTTTPS